MSPVIYTAVRESLQKYVISGDADQPLTHIALQNKIWGAKNAPLSESLSPTSLDCPLITIDGKQYKAARELLTNNFLLNNYKIWLEDSSGQPAIAAHMIAAKWTTVITSQGASYELKRQGFFSFMFTLIGPNTHVVMSDTTPFLAFSNRRSFELKSTEGPVNPLLLSFAFFLGATSIFR